MNCCPTIPVAPRIPTSIASATLTPIKKTKTRRLRVQIDGLPGVFEL
jgi:hypothetical protein